MIGGNGNASEADFLAERILEKYVTATDARRLARFWTEIRTPPTAPILQDALDVALELLVAVYQRAGNHRPAKQRHRIEPGIRDAIRELLKEAGLIEEANEVPEDWEEGERS